MEELQNDSYGSVAEGHTEELFFDPNNNSDDSRVDSDDRGNNDPSDDGGDGGGGGDDDPGDDGGDGGGGGDDDPGGLNAFDIERRDAYLTMLQFSELKSKHLISDNALNAICKVTVMSVHIKKSHGSILIYFFTVHFQKWQKHAKTTGKKKDSNGMEWY